MRQIRRFVVSAFVAGLLVVVPLYLSVLLLLKAMQSLAGLVRPIATMLPASLPAENILSLLLVLSICFFIGVAVRTPVGRAARERLEKSLFERVPGYALFRSLTQQLAGTGQEKVWKPALAEIEEALVPAFIIEELDDGRFTVFVPSVPTPLAGAIYILDRKRVHPLDVPFTQAVKAVSRWGSGSRELVAAMKAERTLRCVLIVSLLALPGHSTLTRTDAVPAALEAEARIPQRDGLDFNLASIPASFNVPHKKDFETEYMRALFKVGYDMAA